MATCDLKVSVCVEKTLHNALTKVLQEIADEQGVMVNTVFTEWEETHGGSPRLLKIELGTTTRP